MTCVSGMVALAVPSLKDSTSYMVDAFRTALDA